MTIVTMDCKTLKIEGQEFALTHAEALLQYQQQKGYNDWKLSPKQPYSYKDGVIVSTGNRTDTEST